jgi:hypothetical protein
MVRRAKVLFICVVGGPLLTSTAIAEQRPALVVEPSTGIAISGAEGGPFVPSTFEYRVRASVGVINYSVRTPAWLSASPTSGAVDTNGVTVRMEISPAASQLGQGVYGPAVAFTNATNGEGSTTRPAVLRIIGGGPATKTPPRAAEPPGPKAGKPATKADHVLDGNAGYLLDGSGGYIIDPRGGRMLTR